MRPFFRHLQVVPLLVSTALAAGCVEVVDRPSDIDTLRVLAVRTDSPFTPPGSRPRIEMLLYDGSPSAVEPDTARRRVQVLWIGTCVNPPGDLYFNCYPALRATLAALTDADLAAERIPAGTPEGALGFGTRFSAEMPADAISSRTAASGVVYPYGVLFVFYAACAGELRHVSDGGASGDLPIGCFRPGSDQALGQEDFEFGYYPVYAYDQLVNHVPVAGPLAFGAGSSATPCTDASACGAQETCGSKGMCIPVVAACSADDADDCPPYALEPAIDRASAEPAVSAHVPESQAKLETIWVSYYGTGGRFDKDARIVNDASAGWFDAYGGVWRAYRASGEVHLFAVVRDNRGGVTWLSQDVQIR